MTGYIAKSTSKLSLSLMKNEHVIGKLSYNRWFSFKAKIELPEGKNFTIESRGFWQKTFEIRDNENLLLKFKRKWNGSILIHTYADNEKEFLFKRKGALKDSFVLLDGNNTALLDLKPGLNWSKISYEYHITTTDSFDSLGDQVVLLLITIHCANAYMAAMVGVIAATA